MAQVICALFSWSKQSEGSSRFKKGEKLSPHLYGEWQSQTAEEHMRWEVSLVTYLENIGLAIKVILVFL